MKFIVKLFPEIMVKGPAVKKRMVRQLHSNLIGLLRRVDKEIYVRYFSDKLEVFVEEPFVNETRDVLAKTPGVEKILEVKQFPVESSLQAIANTVTNHTGHLIEGKTFVVRVKRSGKHTFSSLEAERFIGSVLFKTGKSAGVDLHHAQVTIEIEIDEAAINIVSAKRAGLGGYPMGSQGELLSLMSGGFDSTVASFLTMKRGLKTHYVFFNLGGAAHEIGVKQVALYLWGQYGASHRVKFVTVPFEAVVTEILKSVHTSYMGVTLKRLMLMASERIAKKMNIDVLVTGESVAQVSSQTLRNLAVIDKVTDMLVLRPLATMDKPEIMAIADKIGTRHFAESMPEYCGVISQNPVIKASFDRMEREANKFDYAMLDKAVEDAVTIAVDKIIEDVTKTAHVEVMNHVPENTVVIDIRGALEQQRKPLTLPYVLSIPFHELNYRFPKLNQAKAYLLYCDKGMMSQLHAQYLNDRGFANVRVYRP